MTGRLPTYGRAAIAIAVAFWLTVATFVGATLWRERQQALESASLTAETITALLAESTERTFQNVDLALQAVVHQLEMTPSAQRDDPGIRAAMRRHLDNSPYVRAIFVVDPDGFIVHHTEPQPQQASLADRDYFIVHRDDPSRLRAISEPIESRRGTGWFVAVTRRIGDGSTFRGVVVAAIRLAYFSDLYDRLGLGDGQSITLFHTDGRLIARHPPADDRIGQSYSDFPMFRDHLPQRPVGVYFSEGPPIPFRRLMSYRRLESRPLVVSSGHAESVILASWHRAATASGIGLLALAVFLGAAVWQFVRQQRQRERAAAQQRRTDEALALAEANAKFRTFFEQGSFFKILLSPEGVVLEANRMSLETTGFTRDDAIGRKFWECGWWNASPEIADSVRDAVAHGLRGERVRHEITYFSADGSERCLDMALSSVTDAGGRPLFLAVTGHDVTDRRRAEEELRRLADELAQAVRHEAEFIATLAHELRNLLTPLHNGLYLQDRVRDDPHARAELRAMMERQLGAMTRLVNDLLDIDRIQRGEIALAREPVPVGTLVDRAIEASLPALTASRHELTVQRPDDALTIDADPGRIVQVVINLLTNAAKYTPPGGRIEVTAHRDGGDAVVAVADNGIGIPPESLGQVFEMFAQVGRHRARSQGGLGIGLSLAQRIVTLHGGSVEARSDGAGKGSTFVVRLPLAPCRGAATFPARADRANDDPPHYPSTTHAEVQRPRRADQRSQGRDAPSIG